MKVENLYEIMEQRRAENVMFSHPFIVRCPDGRKLAAWFEYRISGKSTDSLFAHISRIYTVDESMQPEKTDVVLDAPCGMSDEMPAILWDYLPKLQEVYDDFTEEKMNMLLQDMAFRPLFKSFMLVRAYVRTHC